MKKFLAGFIVVICFGFWSTNASAQWKRISLPVGDTEYKVTALASSLNYIYAGGSLQGNSLLFRSSDNGETWMSIGAPLLAPVVAMAANYGKLNVVLDDGGDAYNVMYSSNYGANWKNISPPHPAISSSARSIIEVGSDVFIGTAGSGMYSTNDNGSTWDTTGEAFGDTSGLSLANNNIFALYTDANIDVVFGGTGMGVYVASFPLQGGGWTPLNTGIETRKVNAITQIGSELFAGTDSGIFSSVNSGSSWEPASPFPSPFYSLATNGKDFFAAIGSQNGVDYSPDSGRDWYAANDGLSVYGIINAFALTISGDYVYLASDTSGLWMRPLSDLEGVSKAAIANQSALSQNFPNPFNASTTIHYSLAQEDRVSLSVYNMLGERVALLKDDVEHAGDNEATFEAGALPSGLYCYRLSTTSGGTTTRIMQIER